MSWLELSFNATSEAVDWVRTLLSSAPGEVCEVQVTEFGSPSDWPLKIRLYLPAIQSRLIETLRLLSPLQRTGLISELETSTVATKPVQSTPAHRIGRFILLAPDAPEQPTDAIALRLSPSLSFGSGFHPATVLSLRLLERYVVPGIKVLDLGCGSGILSVAAAKLGAEVLALDNDDTAVAATQQAVLDNAVAELVVVKAGSLGQGSQLGHWMGGTLSNDVPMIQPSSSVDLIVANIFSRIHLALASDYQQMLRSSGIVITSGYTTDAESDVDAALTKAGFAPLTVERVEEWVAVSYRLQRL
jgi:ribosomal protein L11 methyltransferase